ncbi:hypothetical protein M9H77_05513 [Catharanthus roseus]|uniref:Uncharacterized protein n=1 Tax=Catharanthus roseus TaxID=4058 RepID=A0ACC0CHB8_CATRO|nr:hypothetical protein M9H77_05513 [Catharanthus roseus]
MAFISSSLRPPQMSLKVDCSRLGSKTLCITGRNQRSNFTFGTMNRGLFPQQSVGMGAKLSGDWSFFKRSTALVVNPNLGRSAECRKSRVVYASCLPSPQIAYSAFTIGTAAVLPFYTFMVVAPKAEFTKKLMASSMPYIALGLLYAYLLFLSWTPDTIRLMFSNKYWLPELPAIAKLFSSEMTLASAWIHLLVIDLFAARQVFHEGLQENIETRHSVSLCLLFCPIGVFTHFVTKVLTEKQRQSVH